MMKAIDSAMLFYSCNYINRSCEFEYSDKILDFTKLCDFEPYNSNFLFSSAGASLSFSCLFKDKFGKFIQRSVDVIIIQNTNIQSIEIKCLDHNEKEVSLFSLPKNANSEIRITLPNKVNTSK